MVDKHKLAKTLKDIRTKLDLTLNGASEISGVSRSMINKIETAKSSPTAETLGKLSAAYRVPLSEMLSDSSKTTIRRATDIRMYRDKTKGIFRETLSPDDKGKLQLVRVKLEAGNSVSYPEGAYQFIAHEQIHILLGTLILKDGVDEFILNPNDTIEFTCRNACTFSAPANSDVTYLVLTTNV
ncbi:MAG: XRE family transcriptional regulator [Roseibium sp.]